MASPRGGVPIPVLKVTRSFHLIINKIMKYQRLAL